jgi:hypothetical protein
VADVAPLPERARLFHVGIPKSGTTALQKAASLGREDLRKHGVLYPGTKQNQREAVLSFMERRWGWDNKDVPPKEHWQELVKEIEAEEDRRVLFGHEFASESDVETAKKFVDAIGDRCHIVITLRSLGSILPSAWQQYVKAGVAMPFDDWLEAVIGDPPNLDVTKAFHIRNNQGGVVQTWADAAGADRVTVVVLDKQRPNLLFDAFEQLLAIPPGTLAEQELGGFASNRGLTVPEAELFLALNEIARPKNVQWNDWVLMVRNGAVRRTMEKRIDSGDEKLQLPPWAVKRAAEVGAGYADAIAASGVRVIGDLSTLGEEVPARPHEDPPPTMIPVELAAEALAGMLSAATYRGAFFGRKDEEAALLNEALHEARIKKMARRQTFKRLFWFTTAFIGARFKALARVLRGK